MFGMGKVEKSLDDHIKTLSEGGLFWRKMPSGEIHPFMPSCYSGVLTDGFLAQAKSQRRSGSRSSSMTHPTQKQPCVPKP